MTAVVAEAGKPPYGGHAKGDCGRVFLQDCLGALAVAVADVVRELGEAEIDHAMQLPEAVAGILDETF